MTETYSDSVSWGKTGEGRFSSAESLPANTDSVMDSTGRTQVQIGVLLNISPKIQLI